MYIKLKNLTMKQVISLKCQSFCFIKLVSIGSVQTGPFPYFFYTWIEFLTERNQRFLFFRVSLSVRKSHTAKQRAVER